MTNINQLSSRIFELENKYRESIQSRDEFIRLMAYSYKTEILQLTKEKNKYIHQLVERKDPVEAAKEVIETLRWLSIDASSIEHSEFKKLFKKCVIVSKKLIYFVIGNENMTEIYKNPSLYFKGEHTYKIRQTEFSTIFGIYINK